MSSILVFVQESGLIPSVFGDLTGARIVMPWIRILLQIKMNVKFRRIISVNQKFHFKYLDL